MPVSVSACLLKFTNSDIIKLKNLGGVILANIKSAKKRILVNRTKADRNKAIRSAVKTYIKKVDAAVANNDKAAAEAALSTAKKALSMAASKGVYHKNTVSRKVSRLAKAVSAIA